jgi:glycosyltransferase involved in cell wall biosynthesis
MLRLELVDPAATAQLFAACDLVVLPYREILNSGTAMLALSYDRPVLLPDQGATGDLAAAVGPAWVRTYPGVMDPATLVDALAWARTQTRPSVAPLDPFEWSAIATATLGAYRRVVASHGAVGS